MIHFSRSVLAVGGVVLAAGVIGFTNPKTVHAVAAALVEVTNTASNPVVNSDVTMNTSQFVELYCDGSSGQCKELLPDGTSTGAYVVPAGDSLVITDLEMSVGKDPNTTAAAVYGRAPDNPTGPYQIQLEYAAPDDGASHALSLKRGSVFPSGDTIAESSSGAPVFLWGYLTSN